MKLWIICIAIALLAAPTAFAGEDDTTRTSSSTDAERSSAADQEEADLDNIIAVLSHYHQVPDRKELERVTEDAKQIVFELARDDDAFLFHRQRAMRALANWPTDEVYEYLVDQLHDDSTEDGLRHHLLPVLAEGFGERALDDLTPYLLESNDPQIRITAASAISSIPGETAHEQLVKALHGEENPVVRSRIENFATRIR